MHCTAQLSVLHCPALHSSVPGLPGALPLLRAHGVLDQREGSVCHSGSVRLTEFVFYQKSCQTGEVATAEVAVQSRSSRDAAVQTDQSAVPDVQQGACVDDSSVLAFLRRVEEVVIKELNRNVTSRAFDGFDVNWTDQNRTVSWQCSDPCRYLGQLLTVAVTPYFCSLLP